MNRIHISELRTGSKIETPFTGAKKSARHAKFLAPCIVYPCRDLLREVVLAPLKFWALVPHYIWDRYVYTSKIVSAMPSNRQHSAKNLACRADFLALVDGVWETQLVLIAGKTFGRIVFALVP